MKRYKAGQYEALDNNDFYKLIKTDDVSLDTFEIHPDTKVIGREACADMPNLTSVLIPSGVTKIEDEAFARCEHLTNINFPKDLSFISETALQDCPLKTVSIHADGKYEDVAWPTQQSLENIIVVQESNIFGDVDLREKLNFVEKTKPLVEQSDVNLYLSDGTKLHAVSSCQDTIEIPQQFQSIDCLACSNNKDLKNLIIDDNIAKIGDSAFNGCSNLETVHIGKNVWELGYAAFGNCPELKSFDVSEDNRFYASVNGDLFESSGRTLIRYAVGKEDASYQVPDGTLKIEDGAFALSKNLQTITLSDEVSIIGDCAFIGCSKLENINIPDSVKLIGGSAFAECEKLEEIHIPMHTKFDGDVFDGCDNLKRVFIGENLITIENPEDLNNLTKVIEEVQASNNVAGSAHTFMEMSGNFEATDFIISNGTLEEYWGNESIVHVIDDVKEIGPFAFSNNEAVQGIILPEGIEHINSNAFAECPNLSLIVAPESFVEMIREQYPNIDVEPLTQQKSFEVDKDIEFEF